MRFKNIFKDSLDLLLVLLIKSGVAFLELLPRTMAQCLVKSGICLAFRCLPKYKKISLINLRQVFPDRTPEEYLAIYQLSLISLSRLVVDFAKLGKKPASWVREHVRFPKAQVIENLVSESHQGVLFVTGHLGSFEFLSLAMASYGLKGGVIARAAKHKRVQEWWVARRGNLGIGIIDRKGAFRQMLKYIRSGKGVGVIFDQNVTRNVGVFGELFGREAATTVAPAFVALETQTKVIACALRRLGTWEQDRDGDEQFVIDVRECNVEHIYRADWLTKEEKLTAITAEMNRCFEELLLLQPEGWFWIHRRWKTVREYEQGATEKDGAPKPFYEGC